MSVKDSSECRCCQPGGSCYCGCCGSSPNHTDVRSIFVTCADWLPPLGHVCLQVVGAEGNCLCTHLLLLAQYWAAMIHGCVPAPLPLCSRECRQVGSVAWQWRQDVELWAHCLDLWAWDGQQGSLLLAVAGYNAGRGLLWSHKKSVVQLDFLVS